MAALASSLRFGAAASIILGAVAVPLSAQNAPPAMSVAERKAAFEQALQLRQASRYPEALTALMKAGNAGERRAAAWVAMAFEEGVGATARPEDVGGESISVEPGDVRVRVSHDSIGRDGASATSLVRHPPEMGVSHHLGDDEVGRQSPSRLCGNTAAAACASSSVFPDERITSRAPAAHAGHPPATSILNEPAQSP